MENTNNLGNIPLAPKKHYPILDGLRGVAALMVLIFHIFEMFNIRQAPIQHGYIAVDFFFLLSGFVLAHAYDNRWNTMTVKEFFKRRLIRLHPMIIFGMTFGALLYYFSASSLYPDLPNTTIWMLLGVLLLNFFLIPTTPSMDLRSFGEMYPLNGPAWTLFFEYIANVLYVFVFRKFSTRILSLFVILSAIALAHFSITNGNVIGGWKLTPVEFQYGLTRLLYPFLAGMLLRRVFKPIKLNNAFLWSSLLLILIMAMPILGNEDQTWINGLYEAFAIIVLFPIVIFLGASGNVETQISNKVCRFLGDISYPLYIIHYPIMYIYFGWIVDNKVQMSDSYLHAGAIFFLSIGIAYCAVKFYDTPIRKKLTQKFLTNK